MKKNDSYYLYILECADKSLYTGITNNLEKRLEKHNKGLASKYTRARLPVKFLYIYKLKDKSQALKYEILVKSQSRAKKLKIIGVQIDITSLIKEKEK